MYLRVASASATSQTQSSC